MGWVRAAEPTDGLLDGEVCWFRPLEDLVHEDRGPPEVGGETQGHTTSSVVARRLTAFAGEAAAVAAEALVAPTLPERHPASTGTPHAGWQRRWNCPGGRPAESRAPHARILRQAPAVASAAPCRCASVPHRRHASMRCGAWRTDARLFSSPTSGVPKSWRRATRCFGVPAGDGVASQRSITPGARGAESCTGRESRPVSMDAARRGAR